MMLSILVPQYNECDAIVKRLLDSIAFQHGIDFNDIEVIIVNDGSDTKLSKELLESYDYEISYIENEHKGVSATRNKAFSLAHGDYVMFCDADDCFSSMFGLHQIFAGMSEGHDAIVSSFIEEVVAPSVYRIVRHDKDSTFVHGKVYKKSYIEKIGIKFPENITCHEDGYFNGIALAMTNDICRITAPFYTWCWRGDSVARTNDNFTLRTYPQLIKQRILITEKLKSVNNEHYEEFVCKTFLRVYYDSSKPEWNQKSMSEYVAKAEKAFKLYFDKYFDVFKSVSAKSMSVWASESRIRAVNEGMVFENKSIAQFINHMVTLK